MSDILELKLQVAGKHPVQVLGSKQGTLQEQYKPLSVEPYLQPLDGYFLIYSSYNPYCISGNK